MASQKMGGCKKRRRKGVATGNPRAARAGRNMRPRCGRPFQVTHARDLARIDGIPMPENDQRITFEARFRAMTMERRKKVYGFTSFSKYING